MIRSKDDESALRTRAGALDEPRLFGTRTSSSRPIEVDPRATQTGLIVGENSNNEISAAFVISLFGLLFMLCVTGIVVDLIRKELEAWRPRGMRGAGEERTHAADRMDG